LVAFSELVSSLSHDRHLKGRQFERVCRWYLENDPVFQHQIRKVWLWKDWPDRWGADAGIDLVAETHTGDLWAVQVKAYASSASVTKADIDTFLSESSRPQFAMRLLVVTTDHVSHNAHCTIEAQEKPVRVVSASELGKAALEWPEHPDDVKAKPLPRKKPRPHQRAAIKDVLKGFEESDRGQLIMACGTGKTMVSMWVWEALEAPVALVVLPSISLLAQTVREWCANARVVFDFLAVCSDESVTASDLIVRSPSELPFATTTDPAQIASFMSGEHQHRRVIFSTYHSTPRIAEAVDGEQIDLVVADEAHRCAGRTDGGFATVLDDDAISARRRLFMTATPRFLAKSVKKAAEAADIEVVSMDDEAVFGLVFHALTFGEAIAKDLLTDYQVAIVGVDDRRYLEMAEQAALVQHGAGRVTDARTLAAQAALLKGIAKYDLRRCVTFHLRVARAKQFADSLHEVADALPKGERPTGELWAEHVSGVMMSSTRDARLDRLRNLDGCDRALLANARCLAEGIDVPALDAIAFIDPKESQVDIVQAVGRVIRRAPDKRQGTVVLPVFIGEEDDAVEAVSGSAFAPVWRILNALRAHDDVLAEELDALRIRLGRLSESGHPPKVVLDLPASVNDDFVRAFDTRLIEETTQNWFAWYGVLQGFVARHGHARVPQAHVESGVTLGMWAGTQRKEFTTGRLAHERIALLEALPGWTWDPFGDQWTHGFAALEKFVEREGHARVPAHHQESGERLGGWVAGQRKAYFARRLSPERSVRLASLPGWTWDAYAEKWERSFAALKQFVEREGHPRVPGGHTEAGCALGNWVSAQRRSHAAGELSPELATRLESLPGWTWDPVADLWGQNFAALTQFVEREGHARVPQDHMEAGLALGAWVGSRRWQYRQGRLSRSRAEALASLPGWTWDSVGDRWEQSFAALEQFVEREGHARVPKRHTEAGRALSNWVIEQRQAHSAGELSPERTARLENLGGWSWDPFGDRWDRYMAALSQFVEREGHARVPKKHDESGVALGAWVQNRRQDYRAGRLSQERIDALKSLPGWVWSVREPRARHP
jgi:superfamily II DNA or RNA helicase